MLLDLKLIQDTTKTYVGKNDKSAKKSTCIRVTVWINCLTHQGIKEAKTKCVKFSTHF